jgi:hypothetical protein
MTHIFVKTLLSAMTFSISLQAQVKQEPVTVRGEQFYRGGKPVRFWGVNINLQPWATREIIDAMTERFDELGFNAVRAWPNSQTFYGIDVRKSPPPQGIKFVKYKKGDGTYLDLYDYLLYKLKEKGIGVYCPSLLYYPPYSEKFADIKKDSHDKKEWIDAMKQMDGRNAHYCQLRYLHYIDERIDNIRYKHAAEFLNHINPYTGIRNADENNIVIWDLQNESRFIWALFCGNAFREGKRAIPPYFLDKFKKRFSEYLKNKYKNEEALSKAWGTLNNNETLEKENIDIGIRNPKGKFYPRQRGKDFLTFLTELVNRNNLKFLKFVRTFASDPKNGIAVSPINMDTFHVPNLPNFACELKGSCLATGIYPSQQQFMPGGSNWAKHPEFPWDPLVYRSFRLPIFDFARPAGKPIVVYETNYNSFALYDAEYPWIISAYASWQNYNGIFWYNFNIPDPDKYLTNPYGKITWTYKGTQIWGDEIFCSALKAAGEAYKSNYLPQAQNPVIISYGKDAVTDPAWLRFQYNAKIANGQKPEKDKLKGLTIKEAENLYEIIRHTAFEQGHRISVSEEAGVDVSIKGKLSSPHKKAFRVEGEEWGEKFTSSFGVSARPSKGLEWRWKEGVLYIDTPCAKAFVGFPHQAKISWSDGFSVNGFKGKFITIGLVSRDGKPLNKSGHFIMSAVCHSYNEGMRQVSSQMGKDGAGLDDVKVSKPTVVNGDGPLIVHRPDFTLRLPKMKTRKAFIKDFSMDIIAEIEAVKELRIRDNWPVFEVEFKKENINESL